MKGWVGLGGWLRNETVYLPEGRWTCSVVARTDEWTAVILTQSLWAQDDALNCITFTQHHHHYHQQTTWAWHWYQDVLSGKPGGVHQHGCYSRQQFASVTASHDQTEQTAARQRRHTLLACDHSTATATGTVCLHHWWWWWWWWQLHQQLIQWLYTRHQHTQFTHCHSQ